MRFPVLSFTGIVEVVNNAGVLIDFAHVSSSGFTRTEIVNLSLLFPCDGMWSARMQLALPVEFHDPKKLEQIRCAVFQAIGIPLSETWEMIVCLPSVLELCSEPNEGHIMLVSSG